MLDAVRDGLRFLKRNRGILDLILFLAAINLIASLYNAALPAMLLSRQGGGQAALGLVNACSGAANVAGSVAVSLCRPPKSRVRVICNALLFSMSTENLLLALGRSLPVWCVGAVLGWLLIPVMNANMNALLRSRIPVELQGRVYAARNTLQFFTIPVGYLLGGVLVDRVCEPLMAAQPPGGPLVLLLGEGKGSGAALLYLALAAAGVLVCLAFRRDKAIWALEKRCLTRLYNGLEVPDMGYSREVYDAALAALEKRRIDAVNRAAALKDRMAAKYPRVREIEAMMAGCSVQVAKAVLDGGDVEAAVERIKNENLALQAELAALLAAEGEDARDFEPRYTCPRCGDTGYAGGQVCACLKNLNAGRGLPAVEPDGIHGADQLRRHPAVLLSGNPGGSPLGPLPPAVDGGCPGFLPGLCGEFRSGR